MGRLIIGISANMRNLAENGNLPYDTVARHLSQAVETVGGLAMILPISKPETAKDYIATIDKLILSGGQNVDPSYYGEEKTIQSDDYAPNRDAFELALIQEALRQDKPILAICRGMQLVNVALGGSLYQSIEGHWDETNLSDVHEVVFEKDSLLGQLLANSKRINSLHRQGIKQLAPTLVRSAIDPHDGTIEAFEGQSHQKLLGIQWHPELMFEQKEHRVLFDYFVNQF
ncbi:gamma-glutamyl-gamma-aminobutyrate hydrolase family protein [Streptococcus halichoeri]|uniref:gamma-glutamyl-gamma-aminobutyrate hydrolase family protein n=1 Tax=Streptococcus halichoeri TaxID=254785 RepID=UPI0022A743ED|nr:gamma-glutamyl-gamma-aminobutyrate hydrolase family protein [Streptococcus halichoeri]